LSEVESNYICGLELSGDPRTGKFEDYIPIFEAAREQGYKISLHCAETADQASES